MCDDDEADEEATGTPLIETLAIPEDCTPVVEMNNRYGPQRAPKLWFKAVTVSGRWGINVRELAAYLNHHHHRHHHHRSRHHIFTSSVSATAKLASSQCKVLQGMQAGMRRPWVSVRVTTNNAQVFKWPSHHCRSASKAVDSQHHWQIRPRVAPEVRKRCVHSPRLGALLEHRRIRGSCSLDAACTTPPPPRHSTSL